VTGPLVPCPTCGKSAPFAPDNPWRPFCCARCRSIDLGAWASEAYKIPSKEEGEGDPGAGPEQ
jgi:endogenous inhibitor of DNA gyrase (YacG/DUF329 family)